MHAPPPPGIGDSIELFKVLRRLARAARNRPSPEESTSLKQYVRTLENRRVLSVTYNVEVIECCNASLSTLLEITEQTLVRLDHAHARLVLETIQDATRRFLDRWRGLRTREHDGFPWEPPDRPWHMRGEAHAMYFLDLGELRSIVRQMVRALQTIEPGVEASTLLGAAT